MASMRNSARGCSSRTPHHAPEPAVTRGRAPLCSAGWECPRHMPKHCHARLKPCSMSQCTCEPPSAADTEWYEDHDSKVSASRQASLHARWPWHTIVEQECNTRASPGPGKGAPSQGNGCRAGPASEAGGPSEEAGMIGGRHCSAEGPTPEEAGRYPGKPMPAQP